mgnify:FL=1
MVEKMKLLHITGPKNDIDRVMGKYLSKYDIHFENAIASLSTLANVRPFVETNVYKDTYAKAKMLWEYTKEEDLSDVEKIPSKEAERIVDTTYTLVEEILEKQKELKQEKVKIEKLMEQIAPFRGLDYEFKKILAFHFIDFRFGRIARDYYQKLEKYFHDTDYALFYECQSNEDYVYGVYFVPKMYAIEVDAVCLSFHFERLYIPDSFEGTPDLAYEEAQKALQENEVERKRLEQCMSDTLAKHRKKLQSAYLTLRDYCDNFDIRKMAVCTKPKDDGSEYYILYGWMSRGDAAKFEREIADDPLIHVIEEDVDGKLTAAPPTKLKNPKIFKPFEMFVEMYGLPAYNEMDPTIFIALTYTLMFGIMFGDVGQGLVLLIGGFLLYRFKRMNLAAIISLAGVWSTFFGFMYGSIFGFEDKLNPVWMRPMDNIMTTLMLAVGFGMVLILIAMIINIVNAVRAKELGTVLFGQSGLAGMICYGTAVLCIVLYVTGHPIPATGILAVAVGVPLVAIMFKEPLSNLVERKSKILPDGSIAMYIVEALVELFDVVLSYATNSISFVRVGAFALSHAGMMGVVLTLAGYESGSPNWIVVVLGNIVVTALEGLVVGIQVLRLEYYEMFSRFYKGSGKPFKAYFKKENQEG